MGWENIDADLLLIGEHIYAIGHARPIRRMAAEEILHGDPIR